MFPARRGTGAENSGTLARACASGNRPRPPPAGVAGDSSIPRPLLEVLMKAAKRAPSLTRSEGQALVTALVEPPQLAAAWAPAVHWGIWVTVHCWVDPAGRDSSTM